MCMCTYIYTHTYQVDVHLRHLISDNAWLCFQEYGTTMRVIFEAPTVKDLDKVPGTGSLH